MARSTKPAIHASSIKTFDICELKWANRHLEGIRIPAGLAALTGTAVHGGAEVAMHSMVESGVLPDLEVVQDATRDKFKERLENEGVTYRPEDKVLGVAKARGKALDDAIKYAGVFYEDIAPEVQPVNAERKFRVVLEDQPWDLIGRWDWDEATSLTDLKTAKSRYNEKAAQGDTQLMAYAVGRWVNDGQLVEEVKFDVIVKTKKPYVQEVCASVGEEDVKLFLERLAIMIARIETGLFTPAAPGAWQCSEAMCEFYNTCPFGARKVVTSRPMSAGIINQGDDIDY